MFRLALMGLWVIGGLSVVARAEEHCADCRLGSAATKRVDRKQKAEKSQLFLGAEGFERTDVAGFAHAVRDPDGNVWATYKGVETVRRAEAICKAAGGFLPGAPDYRKLLSHFSLRASGALSEEGKENFESFLANMDAEELWTYSRGNFQGEILLLSPANGLFTSHSTIGSKHFQCLFKNLRSR